jgi:hypothetical protein
MRIIAYTVRVPYISCHKLSTYYYPHMKYRPATTKEIDNIIKSLKAKDSYGYNEISTEVPKIGSSLLYNSLNYMCNRALTKGIFPDGLKLSVIKPLYEKVNKVDSV